MDTFWDQPKSSLTSRRTNLEIHSALQCSLLLLPGNDGRIDLVRFVAYITARTVRRRFHRAGPRRVAVVVLYVGHRHVVVDNHAGIAAEHLMLLRYRLVAYRAHLHHALRTDGAGARRRLQRLYVREVGLLLRVRAAVQQTYAAGRVLQGARVADERGGVQRGALAFAQCIVAFGVRHTLSLNIILMR